jgi:hypothetical protein
MAISVGSMRTQDGPLRSMKEYGEEREARRFATTIMMNRIRDAIKGPEHSILAPGVRVVFNEELECWVVSGSAWYPWREARMRCDWRSHVKYDATENGWHEMVHEIDWQMGWIPKDPQESPQLRVAKMLARLF